MAEVIPIPITPESALPQTPEQAEKRTSTAGQIAVNLIWERTQSQIAKVAIYATLSINCIVIMALIILRQELSTVTITVILASLGYMNTTMGIIVGFYFSRTNHTKVGGVGLTEGKER